MAEKPISFQPGAILHDAIMGAFKARGGSFEAWLSENGINPATARGATFGQSKGPKGRALLERIIAAAGPEVVRAAYVARITAHLDEIEARGRKK